MPFVEADSQLGWEPSMRYVTDPDCNDRTPNQDGLHIDGSARDGLIRNLRGHTNDDLVALNRVDGADCRNRTHTVRINENVKIGTLVLDDVEQVVPDSKPLILRAPSATVGNLVRK